ncbi:MAG: hypothetical protein AAFU65_00280 [Pseudomonadota bacterium]
MRRAGRRAGTWVTAFFCATVLAADTDDMAFLEFLGSFSDDDGEWLDPLALEEAVAVTEAASREDDADDASGQDEHDDT